MTCEVVHPPPESPGTGAAKDGERYNKVEGSHGEVSRTHGEVGTRAGTCRSLESWRFWLGSATPPARAAGIRPLRAVPRPPPRRQESGLARAGRCVHGSRPAGAGCLERRAGPGGTGRGQPLSQRPAPLCSSRRLASSSRPGFPRPEALHGARAHGQIWIEWVPPRTPCTDGWTQTQQCETCSAIQAQMQSHLGSVPPCPRGRSRSRPTPPTLRAPGREPQYIRRKITSPHGRSKMPLESRSQSNTLQNCQGFLEQLRGPNLFYNKV